MSCVKERKSIGRNQPQSIFKDEIFYVDTFNVLLNKFKMTFMKEAELYNFIFSEADVEMLFNEELKKNQLKDLAANEA